MSAVFPDITPSPQSRQSVRALVTETRFGHGMIQRVGRGLMPQREWRVVFTEQPIAAIQQIDRFLTARNGKDAFLWTPPDGQQASYSCASWQIYPLLEGRATLDAVFVETIADQQRVNPNG